MILIFTELILLGPLGSMAVQVYFAVSNKLARVHIDEGNSELLWPFQMSYT